MLRNKVVVAELEVGSANMAAIAQLGECQTEDLKVPGSIPGLGRVSVCPHYCLRFCAGAQAPRQAPFNAQGPMPTPVMGLRLPPLQDTPGGLVWD